MPIEPFFSPTISHQIPEQFPDYFREEGPIFVEFVKQYYIWMESQGKPLFYSRQALDLLDIDSTLDEFIIHFKNKFLPNIQLSSQTNYRQLVKHSLDIYRSRGTDRSVNLLLRLIFGVRSTIYRPSTDIFRLSDGRWMKPTYIEINAIDNPEQFINRQIRGVLSKTTAFVERYVRRLNNGRIVNVLYISNVVGTFQAGEPINFSTKPLPLKQCPTVIGSMSSLVVSGSGSGFSVGDIADVKVNNRYAGRVRVKAVKDFNGSTSTALLDGGYGYTANTIVQVSDKVLDVLCTSLSSRHYFSYKEQIKQAAATITVSGNAASFPVGTSVFTYTANVQSGSGTIASVSTLNTTATVLTAAITTGNLSSSNLYSSGNAAVCNILSYADRTATATIISESSNVVLSVIGGTGAFSVNETVTQTDAYGVRASGVVTSVYNYSSYISLTLTNTIGVFNNTNPVVGQSSTANGQVGSATVRIGVNNVNGTLSTSSSNIPFVTSNGAVGNIVTISLGSGAAVSVANTDIGYTETVNILSDPLSLYASKKLNDVYGFPNMPTANIATPLRLALSTTPVTLGKIISLSGIQPGNQYNIPPLIRVVDPLISRIQRRDWVMRVSGLSSAFNIGEVVTQNNGARGMVKAGSNTSVLFIQRMSLLAEFKVSNTVPLNFTSSGTQAILTQIDADLSMDNNDFVPVRAGYNAVVVSTSAIVKGAADQVEVIDSGFGHYTKEVVTLTTNTAQAQAVVSTDYHGIAQGYYATKGGFLSDVKKIADGDYYQDYSYEVRTAVPFDLYAKMLKETVHPAGSKMFGAVYFMGKSGTALNIRPAVISQTAS